ncbi:hypothetical protein [Roseofilum casamattae]|uniref:Uncharacterized protein n=1 Tax=Roseofilum casamattae BLCC-M143 TaxID=3022442 RepID=A0ABT7BWX2_9CYAN|nr:hypothetical protein [Roseofilum casamattae]MDJ1183693.1 hypothetical protein [Roseofilum casamattae BLCC-M143]
MKNVTSLSKTSGLSEFRLTELNTVRSFGDRAMASDRLRKLWNYLVAVWWNSEEPRIYQKQDKHGNWIYQIYDPVAHERFICDSEAEVRVWLEQRYYIN